MTYMIGKILLLLLDICMWIIIIQVVLSWLIVFNVINLRNPQAANFVRLLERVTAPVYNPLRKLIPPIAGMDITPIVLIFSIYILKNIVVAVFWA